MIRAARGQADYGSELRARARAGTSHYPRQARLEVNLCEAAKRHGASYAVKLSTATPVLEMKAGGPYGAHLESEAALAALP